VPVAPAQQKGVMTRRRAKKAEIIFKVEKMETKGINILPRPNMK